MKRSVAGGAVYIGDGRGKGEGRREVVITSEAREQGGARHVGDGRRGLVWSPDSPGRDDGEDRAGRRELAGRDSRGHVLACCAMVKVLVGAGSIYGGNDQLIGHFYRVLNLDKDRD